MTINVKPETERLLQEEIQNGYFRSVDEIIVDGVQAWREKHRSQQIASEQLRKAVEDALAFAKEKAIPLGGISIKELIHRRPSLVSQWIVDASLTLGWYLKDEEDRGYVLAGLKTNEALVPFL